MQLLGHASTQVAQVWSHRWQRPPDWYLPRAHSARQRPSSRALQWQQTKNHHLNTFKFFSYQSCQSAIWIFLVQFPTQLARCCNLFRTESGPKLTLHFFFSPPSVSSVSSAPQHFGSLITIVQLGGGNNATQHYIERIQLTVKRHSRCSLDAAAPSNSSTSGDTCGTSHRCPGTPLPSKKYFQCLFLPSVHEIHVKFNADQR